MDKEEAKKAMRCVAFAQAFVDAFDELQGTSLFKQQLKYKGNNFVKEVDKFLDTIYKDNNSKGIVHLVDELQTGVNEIIDNQVIFKDE